MNANRGKETINYAIDSNESVRISVTERDKLTSRIHRSIIKKLKEKFGDNMYWSDAIFCGDYAELCQTINYGLCEGNLLQKVINGDITPDILVNMTPEEMDPSANEDIRSEIAVRSDIGIVLRTSKLYTCPRCGHRETTTEDRQTRCADEAPTTIAECVNCGKRWRT